MRHFRNILTVFFALAVTLLAACATPTPGTEGQTGAPAPSGAPEQGGEEVTVVVANNLTIPAAITVYMTPAAGGSRRPIGSVSPNATSTLRYRAGTITGSYRLVADIPNGRPVTSTPFPLTGGERVFWSLRNNEVTFER